ncbi:MAG: response regulator [Desulfobacterales bacterium]|nr:response regulator [Desulfobacterales bacterium]
MKILVVDDEQVVLYSCKRVLEAEGFEVCLVPSAGKALEVLKREGFDLLLIDVKMPEHDGMYLIQEVKKKWPAVPMVVMSGYDTPETIEEAARVGAAVFITKPFTPDELLATVRRVIA